MTNPRYESHPGLKRLSEGQRERFATIANGMGTTGGPYLDKSNVHHLTREGVRDTIAEARDHLAAHPNEEMEADAEAVFSILEAEEVYESITTQDKEVQF